MIEYFDREGYPYLVAARNKDITLKLLDIYGISYTVLAPVGSGTLGLLRELIQRELKMLSIGRKFKPDFIVGTSVHAARVSKLVGAKSIVMCEDDAGVIPVQRRLSYPWASAIVTPDSLKHENYGERHLTYPSYQKLFYLHPNRFTPDSSVRKELGVSDGEKYAIIRLSALKAHHDRGVTGITNELLYKVIELVKGNIRLFISSEDIPGGEFEAYRLPLTPERIHHALAFAEFFLGDSQSMTMEAALVGTPSFRLSSFAGRISAIRELGDYGLAFGFKPGQENLLLDKLEKVLAIERREYEFNLRRETMISEKIDPLPWFLNVLKMMKKGKTIQEVKKESLISGGVHYVAKEKRTED